jgi:hypothetical protein
VPTKDEEKEMTEGTENAGASAPVHAFVHTPGPWVVDYEGSIGHVKSVAERPDYFTPTVARYDTGAVSIGPDEKQANARLIAAAPDLLEACKAALAAIRSACQDGSIIWLDPPYVLPGVHESAAERLQNVIEQAESVV